MAPEAVRRYVVLRGKDHNPEQGWYDYTDSFDSREEAEEHLTLNDADDEWWQVLDLSTGELEIGRFNN